ncbi:MAG: hypothetical protein R3345_08130 [Fulvivirga sp.]|nr:hypothetical protein [Fulvivirga sp.]
MKKLILIISLIATSTALFSQDNYKIKLDNFVSVNSKSGTSIHDGDYLLSIEITSDNKVYFKRQENQPPTNGTVLEITDSYLTAQISETGFLFFDKKEKQLYTIDQFDKQYITTGYGEDLEKVRSKTEKINEWQKSAKKPKEIMSKLIAD